MSNLEAWKQSTLTRKSHKSSSQYDYSPDGNDSVFFRQQSGWDANSYLGSPDGSMDKTDYWSSTQKRSRHGSPTSEANPAPDKRPKLPRQRPHLRKRQLRGR